MILHRRSDVGAQRAGLRPDAGAAIPNREKGTTLIELLVVIVVFLIGILAVVQIFPKGFQILVNTRNNSVAAHLAEDEQERLKLHADQLPQQIIAVHYVNGVPVQDPTRDPYDLGPQGDSVDINGILSAGGTSIGNWLLYSGPNSFRRIIAEGSRVPAPRPVGSNYGGLMLLNFGPIDSNAPVSAYANDLGKDLVLPNIPLSPTPPTNTVVIGSNNYAGQLFDSTNTLSASEYFVASIGASTAGQLAVPVALASPSDPNASLLLPTNTLYNRTYHLRFAAYISSGGSTLRKDFPDLLITVQAITQTSDLDAAGNPYPLISVPISTILSSLGQLQTGEGFIGVDYDSIQVAPEYSLISSTASFSNDPLQYKLLDPNLGVLLFNPVAYSAVIEHPGGAREPLEARVDYDVYDWRILRQEFRLDDQQNLNGGNYGQFALDLQSIKVGTQTGPDGITNQGIAPLEGTSIPDSPNTNAGQVQNDDNFVLVDVQTGGIVFEEDPISNAQLVTINKSTGLVTVNSDGNSGGLIGLVSIPGTTGHVTVNLAGRALRVLYRARQEFSVNVLKSSAYFSLVEAPAAGQYLGEGQTYSPGNGVLIFPIGDVHQQVVIDTVNYTDKSGGFNILHGQSFQIERPVSGGLPQINVASALPSGATITSVQGIKGSSLTVQVLWNPDSFHITNSATGNISLINTWEHGWKKNFNQTTIPAQELQ
jgi:type II secretory pathway pseudopilin PulG